MNFEQALIQKVRAIREQLAKCEDIRTMKLFINVSGRLHDGELELTYSLGGSYDLGGEVKGGNLDVLVEEYLHRFGFDKRNQVKLISYVPETPEADPLHEVRSMAGIAQLAAPIDDEIPF